MRIALDVMGGDYAPDSTIKGVGLALKDFPEGVTILLIGKESTIKDCLQKEGIADDRISIYHAPEVIEMGEHPTKAFSQKPSSSIVIGFSLLKKGEINAFCSAGNTGAMHVGAMFTIRAIEGIIRPGLAGFVPKEAGGFGVIIDIGANADCKPDVLCQFGEIGAIYAQEVLEIPNPKVGLMNLGEEEQKGTLHTQAAFQLLKLNENLNFIGNIEGRDLFSDKADVIVCDGFTGNVILKMAESFYDLFEKRGVKDPFFDQFNYEAIGGSPILGVNGNVVIGHGVSSPLAIKSMLDQALKMADSNVHKKIKESLN